MPKALYLSFETYVVGLLAEFRRTVSRRSRRNARSWEILLRRRILSVIYAGGLPHYLSRRFVGSRPTQFNGCSAQQ